jgi:hypothetical protein
MIRTSWTCIVVCGCFLSWLLVFKKSNPLKRMEGLDDSAEKLTAVECHSLGFMEWMLYPAHPDGLPMTEVTVTNMVLGTSSLFGKLNTTPC